MLTLSPSDLGLPPKFSSWRQYQDHAIETAWDSEVRFVGMNQPTGSGKSLAYMALASLLGRTCVLTSTKALQDQLLADFSPIGLADIRGRANYPCHLKRGMTCDEGADAHCHHRFTQQAYPPCPYAVALEKARNAPLVVTNYAYWILQNEHGGGLGSFKLLVLDEAHAAMDEVCGALSMELTSYELYRMLQARVPEPEDMVEAWRELAQRRLPFAQRTLDEQGSLIRSGYGDDQDLKEFRSWKKLVTKLLRLAGISDTGNWIVEAVPHGHRITPIWPAPFTRSRLFLDVPRVVMVSATLTRKTLELLGVPQDESAFTTYPSVFPARHYPLIHIPTVRVDHRWTPGDRRKWMERIDEILGARLDRKGIIHSVSYERAREIEEDSEYSAVMLLHDSKGAAETVAGFKTAGPPSVLVSPSVGTGHDFPYSACEFQIISKVPWPDCRTPLMAARVRADPAYRQHVMCQGLVQSCGRGMRAVDDRCENFIVDDHIRGVLATCRSELPQWFRRLYRMEEEIPKAPPRMFNGGMP